MFLPASFQTQQIALTLYDTGIRTVIKLPELPLCEPLAVHTVMSYLREEMIYYVLINRFFSCLQVNNADQRSIGKIASYNGEHSP